MDPDGRPSRSPRPRPRAPAAPRPPRPPIAGARARADERRAEPSRALSRAAWRSCAPSTATAEQVKGIDLEFRANEVTAIIGPSGCGKSTMVRCINRMHEEIPGARAEGRVLLDGRRRVRPVGRRGRRAPRDRDGLPEAQPVPDDVDLRQRRRGPAPDLAAARRTCDAQGRGGAARRRACGRRSRTASPSPASGSPAASSSGCASRARSRSTPR